MIKIGDEYLEYDFVPEIVKQIKTPDTIDSAGDFSYSFSIPTTSTNLRLLKIGINRKDKLINQKINCVIESYGNPIHIGYLRIERVTSMIDLSFFSGFSDWYSAIDGKAIYDLDLSAFKLPLANISPSPVIINSWTATEGITYPLLDRGQLKNRYSGVLDTNDFMPMVYIKTVMKAIFQQNGYKLAGEILNDSLYNNLVAGIDDQHDPAAEYVVAREAFVGKGAQAITTTPQLVTFTDETFPHYDGAQNNFSSSRYTADVDMDIVTTTVLELDASVDYILELRKNGSVVDTITSSGSSISVAFNNNTVEFLDVADYLEVWFYTAAGTVNITSGSVDFDIKRFGSTYPQFLFGNMLQSEFLLGIFRMFNVLCTFDQATKTVTANLFKNIRESSVDLSDYVDTYEVDFTKPLEELSKRNIFQFAEGADADLVAYNEQNTIPYGAGVIEPDSEFLDDDQEFDIPFASSFAYFNNKLKANLMGLGIITYDNDSIAGAGSVIGSVTNSAGNALFTTLADHGLEQLDFVDITDTSSGEYIGIGRVGTVPATNTFTLQNTPYISTGAVTGTVLKTNRNIEGTGNIYIGINIPNMLVSDFSQNSTIRYESGTHTRIAYFYFTKKDIGLPIDGYKESAVFGNPPFNGYVGISILDRNYAEQQKYFNDPVSIESNMNIPFNVFNKIDQTKSFRLKTPEMDILAFVPKIEGYTSSENPCSVQLIKLN